MDSKQLLDEALRLTAEERAALAGSAEIRSRLDRVDDGLANAVSWSEARRRIHAAAGRDSQG